MNTKMKIMNRTVSNVCIIGDIHSSPNELRSIVKQATEKGITQFISLGDLWDRGYDPNGTIDAISELKANNQLELVMGNHDWKFLRHFEGQKVSIANEQLETLAKLTPSSIDKFKELFSEFPVAIYDPTKKIFISHAAGGRPADILSQDFRKNKFHLFRNINEYLTSTEDKLIDKKYVSNLLYGITNGQTTEQGKPVRLPLTKDIEDDLDFWVYVFGHIHSANLFPEGNKRVACVDYCSGEEGGKLAALIIRDDATISEENLLFA